MDTRVNFPDTIQYILSYFSFFLGGRGGGVKQSLLSFTRNYI